MVSRKLALALARALRTCPPFTIRTDPAHQAFVAEHRRICPACSLEDDPGAAAWDRLAGKVSGRRSAPAPSPDALKAGQLRPIRPELGGWHDGYYYNPPRVLVLEISTRTAGAVQVAQTHDDPLLAGPGDLVLTTGKRSPVGDVMVECWNVYTLKADHLAPPLVEFSAQVLEAVRKLADDPRAYPDWAAVPVPISDPDPRVYFRELETEVGYRFAAEAAARLLAELEGAWPLTAYPEPVSLMAAVEAAAPGVTWPHAPATAAEVIPLARFSRDQLPMAAADADPARFTAKVVVLDAGRVTGLLPARGVVLADDTTDHQRTLSGRVTGVPDHLRVTGMAIHLCSETGKPLTPSDADWEEVSGSFYARFEGPRLAGLRIELSLFCETSG